MAGLVPTPVRRAAYRAQQTSVLLQCLAAHRVLRAVSRRGAPFPAEVERETQRRYRALLDRDLANVEAGLYPADLLFQLPFFGYVQKLPLLLRDMPRSMRRMLAGNYQDLPDDIDLRRYPPYYRRNFHWQTDGYFSLRSAELYDVAVEFLFLGTADVMRRQVIPPVTRHLQGRDVASCKLLDIACGTGRTLRQIAIAHPSLQLYGVDLSPYYIRAARQNLADVAPDARLLPENGEDLPFKDGQFDAVTSVYLFHELPRNARRNVFREMFRVLRPGGVVVIEDSAQISESGAIASILGRFSREFHEPFYDEYLHDDIAEALTEVGFEVESTEPHFVAKVVTARKP
ncbi:MAG: class I SAM-dependent methyltransferase [Myxococcota bacterium]